MAGAQRHEEANSIIGQDSQFQGKFAVKGAIRIDGKFEGDSLIVDKVFIGPKGKVKTNVKASSERLQTKKANHQNLTSPIM